MRQPPINFYLKVLEQHRTQTRHISKAAMAGEMGIPPSTYRGWCKTGDSRKRPSNNHVRWVKSFLETRGVLSAQNWMADDGLRLLRNLGFSEGDTVVDFGCGLGDYTLMLATVVEKNGVVYSVDKDKGVLSELLGRAYGKGLTNIRPTLASRSGDPPVKLPLNDDDIDAFWLSDVLHDGYFENDEHKKALVSEVSRTLKASGFMALHPVHMEEKRIKKIVNEVGFRLDKEFRRVVLFHGNEFHKGSIFRFRKPC